MEYLIGTLLSLAIVALAYIVGFDRERAYYSTALIVIAAYYVLFAAMAASGRILIIEIIFAWGLAHAFSPCWFVEQNGCRPDCIEWIFVIHMNPVQGIKPKPERLRFVSPTLPKPGENPLNGLTSLKKISPSFMLLI